MKAFNVFLSIAVSFLMALGVLEVGLRLLGFAPVETLNEFHDKTGWSKTPGKVVERSHPEFEITFEINQQGLRDDELELKKKPGTFRVLMLGDSFVLGYTVDREDLFVDILERWWTSEERRVEVINAGTEAYSTDQEVVWFLEEGVKYEPDLVLLFPYDNDIYWNGEDHYQRFPKPRFLDDGTLEPLELEDPGPDSWMSRWGIGVFIKSRFLNKADPEGFFEVPGAKSRISKELAPLLNDEPPFVTEALKRTKGGLSTLRTKCDEIGARLFVVPIPSESVVHEDERKKLQKRLGGLAPHLWDAARPVRLFLDLAQQLEIESLDPRQRFLALAGEGETLYYNLEWHFNPAGNRAFAKFLYAELDDRGVFPPEHRAIATKTIPEPAAEPGGVPTWLKVYGVLWLILTTLYMANYRDEPLWQPPLKVAALLAAVFVIFIGVGRGIALLPPRHAPTVLFLFILGILGFVGWKLGRRVATIAELLKAFVLRGHWYLMPLVVVLLTIGSLLVVAAASPLVAPFIYTLF